MKVLITYGRAKIVEFPMNAKIAIITAAVFIGITAIYCWWSIT